MIKFNHVEKFRIEKDYINRTRIYLYPAITLLKSYNVMRNLRNSFLCCSYNYNSIIIYYITVSAIIARPAGADVLYLKMIPRTHLSAGGRREQHF